MRTAYLVRKNLPDFHGEANLYRLDPPIVYSSMTDEEGNDVIMMADHVITSKIDDPIEELLVFPADNDGDVCDWGEIPGVNRYEANHDRAIESLGYQINKEN